MNHEEGKKEFKADQLNSSETFNRSANIQLTEKNKGKLVEYIKWFSDLSNEDVGVAGGKGASLGEMYNNKFPIPPGFVITAQAYQYFIEKTGIGNKINEVLDRLDINETDKLNDASKEIRKLIEEGKMPKDLESDILEAYDILDVDKKGMDRARAGALDILRTGHEPPFVAVRSSATAEDLADASFAGQQDSFLNVKGNSDLLEKVKRCFSSLFTARAIYYREKKKFEHSKVYLAVVVQRMIDSEKSGVMFSQNPVKGDGSILIEAVFGLGEGIVSGRIKPDNYIVDKDVNKFKILSEEVNKKKVAIVRDSSGKNVVVKLSEEKSKRRTLTDYEIKRLAQYSRKLEEHYSKPQDIEFAIEGDEIYIVQSRPITTKIKDYGDKELSGEVLLSGMGASPGVGSGTVKVVRDLGELGKVKAGDVLVTEMTNPDMVVAMQRAAAIVTDEGGLTSHASIVSREMGIPCVVGTGEATSKLKDGQVVTVDGRGGKVYEGRSESRAVVIEPIVSTKRTKIKIIVDLPDYAERAAKSGVKAIGLTRLEGIIASSGKHPMKFVKEKKMKDYVEILVDGLKKIAAPFDEIWIRSSDIRSDEFRNLEGAVKEVEGNPMMGDHGIRFTLRHPEILKAEFTAVKEVADEYHNKKIGLMLPLVINLNELKEAKRIALEEVGIPKNVKIGVMVETPAAVQIIEELCRDGIDFISFGTNDLTQFTLGIDRNNSDVQYLYDETHPAVLREIKYVIDVCKKYKVESSICGQAGSKPEMAKFLVKAGIDSISVNADAAKNISEIVRKVEDELENEEKIMKHGEIVALPAVVESSVPSGVDSENGVEELVSHKPGVRKAETPIQHLGSADEMDKDIEDIVLQELEGRLDGEDGSGDDSDEEGSDGDDSEGDFEDYAGGVSGKERDIPNLNDAIPIESEDFEDAPDDDEVVFNDGDSDGESSGEADNESSQGDGSDGKDSKDDSDSGVSGRKEDIKKEEAITESYVRKLFGSEAIEGNVERNDADITEVLDELDKEDEEFGDFDGDGGDDGGLGEEWKGTNEKLDIF